MNPSSITYDIARSRIEEQDRRRLHFDTMAWGVLGFGGVIIGLSSFTASDAKWHVLSFAIFVPLLISYLIIALSVYNVVKLRGWRLRPILGEYMQHIRSGDYQDETLVLWVAAEIAKAIEANEDPLDDKARWLIRSYKGFVVLVSLFGMFVGSVIAF